MPDVSTEVAIATTTLGSAAASITFSSIPNTYTDLRFVIVGTTADGVAANLRFNSDSGTNYSATYLGGDGSAPYSNRRTTQAQLALGYFNYFDATIPTMVTLDIFSYTASVNKTLLLTWANDRNGSGYSTTGVGLWRSTAAINAFSLTPNSGNWNTGTTATLYGIL